MSNYKLKPTGKSKIVSSSSSDLVLPDVPGGISGKRDPQRQFQGSTNFNDNQFGNIFVRTVVTIDPDSDLFMKVAQRAYQEHEKSLVPCSKCGRKFFPDRIGAHQSACAAAKLTKTGAMPLQKQKLLSKKASSLTTDNSHRLSRNHPKEFEPDGLNNASRQGRRRTTSLPRFVAPSTSSGSRKEEKAFRCPHLPN